MYEILSFDSKLFGFKVAKILPIRLDFSELERVLKTLAAQDVKLVYWSTDRNDQTTQMAAGKAHGFLADLKVTYTIDFTPLLFSKDRFQTCLSTGVASSFSIHPLFPSETREVNQKPKKQNSAGRHLSSVICQLNTKRPIKRLQILAIEAGSYSRFSVDPSFPRPLYEKLYKKWILNSINGKLAHKVLVYIDAHKHIGGMITLGEKNGAGDIGLLAVHSSCRGLGIGYQLVQAAKQEFIHMNYKTGQVVTQLGNRPACHLYEKCGYALSNIEAFYHFWL